jgi:hypothetical protein
MILKLLLSNILAFNVLKILFIYLGFAFFSKGRLQIVDHKNHSFINNKHPIINFFLSILLT